MALKEEFKCRGVDFIFRCLEYLFYRHLLLLVALLEDHDLLVSLRLCGFFLTALLAVQPALKIAV